MTEQDYDLLSAYIDGELTDDERRTVEQRLKTEPELRRELTAMRQTVRLLNQLPTLTAPRSYALTPEMVAGASTRTAARDVRPSQPPKPPAPRQIIPFPLISALSAAAAVVLIAGGILLMLTTGSADNAPESMASQAESPGIVAAAPSATASLPAAFANTGELSTQERLTAAAMNLLPSPQGTANALATDAALSAVVADDSADDMDMEEVEAAAMPEAAEAVPESNDAASSVGIAPQPSPEPLDADDMAESVAGGDSPPPAMQDDEEAADEDAAMDTFSQGGAGNGGGAQSTIPPIQLTQSVMTLTASAMQRNISPQTAIQQAPATTPMMTFVPSTTITAPEVAQAPIVEQDEADTTESTAQERLNIAADDGDDSTALPVVLIVLGLVLALVAIITRWLPRRQQA